MLERLRTLLTWIVGDSGEVPLTLAIPDARSTFDRGAVGLVQRPPARLRCGSCDREFVHMRGDDMIRCPRCPVERPPERLGDFEILALQCPMCNTDMEHGIRHPNILDAPQWASCPACQYHWELHHGYSKPMLA